MKEDNKRATERLSGAPARGNTAQPKRAYYQKPVLIDLGDVRDITLGGSPGLGDSGAGLTEQP